MKKITSSVIVILLFLIGNLTLFAQTGPVLNASPSQGCAPLAVTFTITGMTNPPYRVEWQFNDGSPVVFDTLPLATTLNHTFSNYGNFNVSIASFNNVNAYIGNINCNQNINVQGVNIFCPDSLCLNDGASFCPNGGGYNSTIWNFGDGSPTSNQNCASHAYTSVGTKTVTLTVNSNQCGNQTATKQVYVTTTAAPHPGAGADNNNSCPGGVINFNTDQYASYSWNFGDGGTSTVQHPSHSYTTTGTKTITLGVVNSCGKTGTTQTTVNISNNPPFPNWPSFQLQNDHLTCPNSNVNFNAPGGYNNYKWHFGDGSPVVTTNSNWTNHTYGSTLTTYHDSVVITSPCGNDTTLVSTVQVTNNAPFPNWQGFTLQNPPVTCPNSNVNFSAPGGFVMYKWHFGDGSPVVITSNNYFNHTYGSALTTYHDTVKITNSCGNDTMLISMVHVTNNAPFTSDPNFTLQNPQLICPNSNVNFNAPGGFVSYKWHFGDGSPVITTFNNWVNHTYGSTLTTYNDSVTIRNTCGNDSTLVSSIQVVNNAPFPNNLNFNSSSPSCPNSYVGFEAPGGYPSYKWNFGDNSPVVITNDGHNNHFYGTVGTYNVSVIITSACGNSTTLNTVVVISSTSPFPSPGPNFQLGVQTPACPNEYVNFNAPSGYPSYVWSFGDGSPNVTTTNNYTNHMYGSTGNYNASLTITNGCGATTTLTATVQIKNNAPFPNYNGFNLNSSSPSCPNSNVGFQAPGGFSIYKYHFGDGSPDVTTSQNGYNHNYGSTIGNDTAWVKITNGCGHDTTLYTLVQIMNNVGFPNQNWFKVQAGPSPACPNDLVNFDAPNGYSNYKWKFGNGDSVISSQNHAQHVYATVGTYTYSVKITNSCGHDTTLYGAVAVSTSGSFYSGLTIETTPNSGSCPGDLVSFHVNPGSFHSYSWDFGDGTTVTTNGGDIQHSFANLGAYNVSCKVKNGCGDSTIIYSLAQVINNSPISGDLQVKGIQNPSCPNDTVFFFIDHGQSTTTYYWNYGDGSPADTTIGVGSRHVYSSVGNKTVTVIAKNACNMTKTVTMTQVISNSIAPSLIGQDGSRTFGYPGGENNNGGAAGCSGDAIVFYFMGSAANNVWNFGDGTTGTATEHMMINGDHGGAFPVTIIKHVFATNGTFTVSLTVTNNCGLSTTQSFVITIGGNQVVNGNMTTSPPPFSTCAPINFIAFGGASYKWNYGDGSPIITTTSPTVSHTFSQQGNYTVTVLVTNGCGNTATYSKSVNVNGAGGPAVTVASSVIPTCVGGTNGTATIAVANGQLPYTYSWNTSPVQSSVTATNLSAGTYSVTVTDNIGCAATVSVSINNPAPIVLAVTTTPSACNSTTGTATVGVTSGGTAPFNYLWSNGGTLSSATGLPFGQYDVTATDAHGCASSSNLSISEVNTASVTLSSVKNVTCNGNTNGALYINVIGGTPPYVYHWSNNTTNDTLLGVVAGNYSLVVTDAGSCHSTFNATIGQPDSISVTTTTVHAPTCGNQDGSASATVMGGTSPYTYLWSAGTNPTTSTVSGLAAGTDSVIVTDFNSCQTSKKISLSNSNAPVITEVVSNVSCFGLTNGAINTTVVGGTSPYTYSWSITGPQATQPDLTGLTAGNYLLFVHDAVNCTSVRIYTIAQPALLTATATNIGATCNHSDGSAMAVPVGGNTPYSFAWTGGQTTQTATTLAVGSYTATVTDTLGCVATASTSIAQITQTPSICMVTVDDSSAYNVVYWDKTTYTSVDSFIVYREVSTSIYKRIGAVAYSALSEFVDTTRHVGPANGDPNVGAYRYKLQIRDQCGDLSAKSHYHNTIYIAGPDNNGNFDWNLPYAIENEDPNVVNYRLLCDTTLGNLPWFQVGAVAGTQANVADVDYQSHKNNPGARWFVKTDWSTACTPTRAAIVTSRSNIRHPGIINGILPVTSLDANITIYPNPAKDNVTIELLGVTKNVQLKIINTLGQIVFNEMIVAPSGKTTKQINTSYFAKGVYTVVVETSTTKTLKKLVVN